MGPGGSPSMAVLKHQRTVGAKPTTVPCCEFFCYQMVRVWVGHGHVWSDMVRKIATRTCSIYYIIVLYGFCTWHIQMALFIVDWCGINNSRLINSHFFKFQLFQVVAIDFKVWIACACIDSTLLRTQWKNTARTQWRCLVCKNCRQKKLCFNN